MLSFLHTVLALALVAGPESAPPTEELTWESYSRIRDLVQPKPEELSFRAIPWRTSLWEALVEAQAKEQPVLLWTMNGHPLACT